MQRGVRGPPVKPEPPCPSWAARVPHGDASSRLPPHLAPTGQLMRHVHVPPIARFSRRYGLLIHARVTTRWVGVVRQTARRTAARTTELDIGAHSKVYRRGMGSAAAPVRGLRVAELAEAAGLSPDTVRYYERAGLLPPPARTAAGYRAYDGGALDRLRFIQGCQRLGLRLREIADLLAIRDTGVCPCEPAEQLLHRRLAEVDAEMARLASLREQIVTMVRALPADDCHPPPAPDRKSTRLNSS